MAKSRKLISFSLSLSPGGARADVRGAHQIGLRAGRVRFIGSRWQGLRFPSPLSFSSPPAAPLPPAASRPPLLSRPPCPSHRRFSIDAGADQRRPDPDEPACPSPDPGRREGASARGASNRLFRRLLAGGRWATVCCPAHAASACSEGLGALALPPPGAVSSGNRFLRVGGRRLYRVGFAARM